jgi:pimeloyl-ACP methyl ester carboxylesterase
MSVTDHGIVVDGLRLHYVVSGRHRSRPIVFLHGRGLSARMWNDVCQGQQSR